MELHSPLGDKSIRTFETFVELLGLWRSGTGMAIFVKNNLLVQQLLSQRFTQADATIEIQSILVDTTILFFLYLNPHTSPSFLRQTVDAIMHTFIIEQQ